MKWTENQQKVVDFEKGNLLVAAAAGSGKTAVLTAHINKKVTNETNPVDIDRLLVVTFTKAAAAEMKERIRLSMEECLEKDPENERLKKQLSLVPGAMITTIDSFCMRIVREHFHHIDLDPGFRLLDEGENSLIRSDILEEMLAEEYQKKEEDFISLRDMIGSSLDDQELSGMIESCYLCASSFPDPREWIDKQKKLLHSDTDSFIFTYLEEQLFLIAKEWNEKYEKLKEMAENLDFPDKGLVIIRKESEVFKEFAGKNNLNDILSAISSAAFDKKPAFTSKDEKEHPGMKEDYNQIFDQRKILCDAVKDMRSKYADFSFELLKKEEERTAPVILKLLTMTENFMERFAAQKKLMNVVDFNDIEHFALDILYENGKPSEVADRYAKKFEEILVDEYQDCNYVQEALFYALSRERFGNPDCFMVGDVKQSIYGFRQAKPEIFVKKQTSYHGENDCYLIELGENFRSRKEVLASINHVFEKIMSEKLGKITYDDHAALHPAAAFSDDTVNSTELLLCDTDEEEEGEDSSEAADSENSKGGESEKEFLEEQSKAEKEAEIIASRIIELLNPKEPFMVHDLKNNVTRPIELKDISILLRSSANYGDSFVRILQKHDIPCYCENEKGYFTSIEVRLILNLLRIIDNPIQDIPLVSVMHSPIGNFSLEELADIRLIGRSVEKNLPFYGCLLEASETMEKAASFLSMLDEFREFKKDHDLNELIGLILTKTGYYYYVKAMPSGEKRSANLKMLIEKAKDFEENQKSGLFSFIRYIDRLVKFEQDFENPSTFGEEMQAVRIMTIHKSKGLEFPVVFLAGMKKKFNLMDLNKKILFHDKIGTSCDYYDSKYHYRIKSAKKRIVRDAMLEDVLAEEERILYVAMTRAKEKLIMTAVVTNLDDYIGKCMDDVLVEENVLSYQNVKKGKNYLDWVFPAFLLMGKEENVDCGNDLLNGIDTEIKKNDCTIEIRKVDKEKILMMLEKDNPEIDNPEKDSTLKKPDFNELHGGLFTWKYPYESAVSKKISTSVSELKKASMEEAGIEPEEWIPKRRKDPNAGAERGTAFHKVMEKLDFTLCPTENENISSYYDNEIKKLIDSGKIFEEEAKLVSKEKIVHFFETDLGRDASTAAKEGKLYKEQQFMLGIPVEEKSKETQSDFQLIKGVIDGFFFKNGTIVLYDYKTDHVAEGDEGAKTLIDRYKTQMDYYKIALEKRFGEGVVSEIWIYSFHLGKSIRL